MEEERCKYIRWVESVVGTHNSSTSLDEFRLFFYLHRSHTDLIDSWLRYALSRKVEKLDLNLTACAAYRTPEYHDCYTFPYKNLLPKEFSFIKKLSTNYVNVSGEDVGMILQNCPLLEHLSLSQSGDLSYLEIIKPFPSFKCLEINLCHYLESLVIRDSNLVSLKLYGGKRIQRVVVTNVPLLTEIWTAGLRPVEDILHMFSSVLPQIEMLKLYVYRYNLSEAGTRIFCSGVEMNNLKQFVVVDIDQNIYDDDSLLPLINLINASPRLQRFVLEAPLLEDDSNASKENIPIPLPIPNPRKMGRKYPYLKEVEFVVNGYVSDEFEMLMHLVENGVALETIVVDTRVVKFHLDSRWDYILQPKINHHKMLAMAHALENVVPSRIKVSIL